jgi:putative membrane protein
VAWLLAMSAAFHHASAGGFAWHMVLHLLSVTAVAPLAALAARRLALAALAPGPLVAAFAELLVVWGWHAPAAHALARDGLGGFLVEQASFVACALLLWASVIDAVARRDRNRIAQSVLALLLTSMHMTLLGAVLALAPGNPYRADLCGSAATGLGPVEDVQLGGVLMLGVAASVYLLAALCIARPLLGPNRPPGQA